MEATFDVYLNPDVTVPLPRMSVDLFSFESDRRGEYNRNRFRVSLESETGLLASQTVGFRSQSRGAGGYYLCGNQIP